MTKKIKNLKIVHHPSVIIWVLFFMYNSTSLFSQQKCATAYISPNNYEQKYSTAEVTGLVLIPVVVHVVWHSPEEQISQEQVASQIDVLNADYRRDNVEIPNIHPLFDDLAADVELAFCLFTITYTETSYEGIYNQLSGGNRRVCFTDLGGHDAIAPDQYLNIWVSGRSDNALGSATAPGQASPGEDGVFIAPEYFGTVGNVSPPYHLGRTCTHEIGHYFGLQHLWGPGYENDAICSGDDGIADTPKQYSSYRNSCPSQPENSCGSPDMFMNFMNYTDDACMALFTPGQKNLIHNVIMTERPGLLDSDCTSTSTHNNLINNNIYISPNPTNGTFSIRFPLKHIYDIAIFDSAGRLVKQMQKVSGPYYQTELTYLKDGLYFLKIKNGQYIYIKKLIIAR